MSYSHLTLQERYVIYHLVLYGLSYREIGRRLNRRHTTITREVKRDGPIGFMNRTCELVPSKSKETRMRCGVGAGGEKPPATRLTVCLNDFLIQSFIIDFKGVVRVFV